MLGIIRCRSPTHRSESIEIERLMVLVLNHYEEVVGLLLCNKLELSVENN